MKKITSILMALVCMCMSTMAVDYLVETGISGDSTWSADVASTTGATIVNLATSATTLNAWIIANAKGKTTWLAAGTYTVTAAVNYNNNFCIYGGFAGTETSLAERVKGTNPWDFTHETVITTDSLCAVFAPGSSRENCYIDGITFHRCYISGKGGAMTIRPGVTVQNCRFTQNASTDQGGAVLMNVGGTVINSYFSGNSSKNGGCIQAGGDGPHVISGCLFENNTSTTAGAGVRSQSTNLTIRNCIFRYNGGGNGSAIYTQTNAYDSNIAINCLIYGNTDKAAVYALGLTMYNCTMVNNAAGDIYYANQYAKVYNSVCWRTTSEQANVSLAPTVNSGSVFNNNAVVVLPINTNWECNNNIILSTANTGSEEGVNYPCFTDVDNADFTIGCNSALLNGGVEQTVLATDFDGVSRPQGSAFDIGAYELPYYTLTVSAGENGTITVADTTAAGSYSVAKGDTIQFAIAGNSGYKVETATYAGLSILPLTDGKYTATVTANATLAATFAADAGTDLQKTEVAAQIFAQNGQIVVRNMAAGSTVRVYNLIGKIMFQGMIVENEMAISVAQGIYMVQVNGKTQKVIVK